MSYAGSTQLPVALINIYAMHIYVLHLERGELVMTVHSVLDLSTLVLVSSTSGIPEQCAPYLADDFTFVGPFGKGTTAGMHAFMDYFSRMAPLITKLDLSFGCPVLVFQNGETSVVFIGSASGERHLTVSPRATLVWSTSTPEKPQLVHMRFSIPPVEKRINSFIPINSLLDSADTRAPEYASLIYIRDIGGVSHAVHPGAVVYLEAAHQYVDVHLLRETFRTRSSLSAMLDRLPATFVRVHRSFAINAKLVTSMSSSKITMSNGEQIYVPVKRRTAVRQQLREAMEVNPYNDAPAAHAQATGEPTTSEATSSANQL
jgi:hypothetical protein